MSVQTLAPADDFEAFEFAALVAGITASPLAGLVPATQPLGEPFPAADESLRRRQNRPARNTANRAAIKQSWKETL